MAERIAFIGIGRIGLPIALNLAGAGRAVVAYDQRPGDEATSKLTAAGAQVVTDPAAAVADADVVITVLPDSAAVEEVITSPAVRSHLRTGAVWIEMSSGYPADTRRLAARLADEHDVELVDAPICDGGVPGAYQARITLCVGGDDAAVERVQPILASVADDIVHVGPIGAGHTVKLLSNFVLHGVNGLMSELYAIGLANGFDAASTAEALRHCAAAKFVRLDAINETIHAVPPAGEPANFRLSLARKDLRYLTAHAASVGAMSPIAQGVHDLYLFAERTGFADTEGTTGPLQALRKLREGMSPPVDQ